MATEAQQLKLLELLNDPWRSMAERGIYGKYGSLAEEMADDYAIAEETAKARLRQPRNPMVDSPEAIYRETFGPVDRRWRGAPAPVEAQVVRGSDGALYEYDPGTRMTRELVAPKAPQQFGTRTVESYDDQGNRITTEQKIPIGTTAASVGGTAAGVPTSFTSGNYTVKLKTPGTAAPTTGKTPTGFIGVPGGRNLFNAAPFQVSQPSPDEQDVQAAISPDIFVGPEWRPAMPTNVGIDIPGIRPPSAFTPTVIPVPGRTLTGEQRGGVSRVKERRIKELVDNLQAGVKSGRVAGLGYPTQESYRKAYEELQELLAQ